MAAAHAERRVVGSRRNRFVVGTGGRDGLSVSFVLTACVGGLGGRDGTLRLVTGALSAAKRFVSTRDWGSEHEGRDVVEGSGGEKSAQ